jgi:hypothetical protein
MKKVLCYVVFVILPTVSFTQTDTTKTTDDFNFEEFGDADNKKIKTYCTQKVNYLSPTKLISVGYESQFPFHWESVGTHGNTQAITPAETHVNTFGGVRLGINTPVISRSNFILNLGVTYWNTRVAMANPERSSNMFGRTQALNSTGLNVTVFKPFNTSQCRRQRQLPKFKRIQYERIDI